MPLQEAVRDGVRSYLKKHPDLVSICYENYQMRNDVWIDENRDGRITVGHLFADSFRQRDNIVCGYILGFIEKLLAGGNAMLFCLEVGTDPSSDESLEENQRKLTKLVQPWKAELWCGKADYDGLVWLPKEYVSEEQFSSFQGMEFADTWNVRLEVGYCDPETLMSHLTETGCFARWPYGSPWIYIFSMTRSCFYMWREWIP